MIVSTDVFQQVILKVMYVLDKLKDWGITPSKLHKAPFQAKISVSLFVVFIIHSMTYLLFLLLLPS